MSHPTAGTVPQYSVKRRGRGRCSYSEQPPSNPAAEGQNSDSLILMLGKKDPPSGTGPSADITQYSGQF